MVVIGAIIGVLLNSMSVINWGLLQKSLIDNETIEQAINRLIAEHEADPESHLGAGESLQSHRASEIIDHLALSIVADKIKYGEITPDKFFLYNSRFLYTSFESIDGWQQSVGGSGVITHKFGGVYLVTGSTYPSYASLYVSSVIANYPNFSKNPYFITRGQFFDNVNQIAYIFLGDCYVDLYNGFGFKIVNGTLYAIVLKTVNGEPVEYLHEITGVDILNPHVYKAIMTFGSKIEFFVDDVLKYTETTYFPDESETGQFFCFQIQNSVANGKEVLFDYLLVNQNL